MKDMKVVSFVLLLVIVSISCSLFTPTGSNGGAVAGDIKQEFDKLPAYDPEAPLPSPGATALRLLMELDPSVAVLESDVEASEREALKALLSELQVELDAGRGIKVPYLPSQLGSSKVASPAARASFPLGYKLVGDFDSSGNFMFEAMFIGILSSQASDSLAVTPGAGEDKSANGSEGSATTKSGVIFKKNPDGSTSLVITEQTDAAKDGVSAKTGSKVSVDGWRCPNEAGQVSFTIKEHLNAESGGTSYTVDLKADVRLEVNDDAEMVSITIDTTQGTRKVKDGRNVYVESGVTNKNGNTSNQRVIRSSQDATSGDMSILSAAGDSAAYLMGLGAASFAQYNWLDGGCTKVEATSPGTVKPGSTTDIPVTVLHRIDGSVVPSKLSAALTGEKSVAPTSLAKTPGTLTYTAPGEAGKSATILLTATSKRGKAKLELKANTGEIKKSYQVIETLGLGRSWTGACIDDLTKPFSLFWIAPESSGSFEISPSSSTSGSLVEKLHFGLGGTTMDYTGNGNYEIIPTDKDAEGNVIGMDIAYSTVGNAISCVGSECVTSEMDSGKGVGIPLRVQDGACSDQ